LTCKTTTQDKIILGNRATTPMTTSRLPSLGQPYDLPLVSWPAVIYIDPLTGTAGSTQYNDLLSIKLSIASGFKPTYVSKNQQVYDRIYQEGSSVSVKFDG